MQGSKSEDKKMAQVLRMSANKWELAKRLRVDVYSNNKVLQKELNSVAWATTLGSLTVSAALAPVGGPAAGAVSLTRAAQRLNDRAEEYPPQRLHLINEQVFKDMGIPGAVSGMFFDNPSYTPAQDLREAGLSARDEESASFFQYMAEILPWCQAKIAPIQDVSVFGPLVFPKVSDGMVIIPLPLDRALWTERYSLQVSGAIRSYKAMHPNLKRYEFRPTGTASKAAKEKSARHGIETVEIRSSTRLSYGLAYFLPVRAVQKHATPVPPPVLARAEDGCPVETA